MPGVGAEPDRRAVEQPLDLVGRLDDRGQMRMEARHEPVALGDPRDVVEARRQPIVVGVRRGLGALSAASDDEVLGAELGRPRARAAHAPELLVQDLLEDEVGAAVDRDQAESVLVQAGPQAAEVVGELGEVAVEELDAVVAGVRDLAEGGQGVAGRQVKEVLDARHADGVADDTAPRVRVMTESHAPTSRGRPTATQAPRSWLSTIASTSCTTRWPSANVASDDGCSRPSRAARTVA